MRTRGNRREEALHALQLFTWAFADRKTEAGEGRAQGGAEGEGECAAQMLEVTLLHHVHAQKAA